MATIAIPADLKKIFGIINDKSTPMPGIKLTYFVGITSTNTDTETWSHGGALRMKRTRN